LTLEDLRGHPERWPRTLALRQEVKGPSNRWTLEKGKEVKFVELEGDKVVLESSRHLSITVAVADSGLVEEANRCWKALTPAQRAIDHEALIADPSLLPAKIKVMEELHVSNEWGQPQPGDEFDVLGYDADGLLMGAADRARRPIYVDARQTDLIEQARQRVLLPEAQRPSRVVAALQGRLVDAQGRAAAPARLAQARFIAIYFGAAWCAPCRKFSPQLVERLVPVMAQEPELQVVFLSNDKTPAAMQAYMQETKMPWPGIGLETWSKVPLLMNYACGTVPQLVVLDRHGKVMVDSMAGGRYVGPQHPLQVLLKHIGPGATK